MTAVVTAVTTTAVSGSGICISITGIFNLGGSGCSSFFSSFVTSSGASRSAGGTTMGAYDGKRALGSFSSILGRSSGLGSLGVGRSILPRLTDTSCGSLLFVYTVLYSCLNISYSYTFWILCICNFIDTCFNPT